MRKQIGFFAIVAMILVCLTACEKSPKEMLIGTWHGTKTITFESGSVRLDGMDTYKEDGTVSSEATAVYTLDTEIAGVGVQMKVGLSMKSSGEWTLNDKELVLSPSSARVKVTSMKYYDPSDGSFLGHVTGSDLTEASNVFEDELNAALLEATTDRIIMQQEDKFVTESTEDDGTKTTITYHRVK